MAMWIAKIDNGEGGETTIQAATLAAAVVKAAEWVKNGEWRAGGHVQLDVAGPDGTAREYVAVEQSEIFA